ncbi:hypothetical protein MBLNU230_g5947t1 [Neophaeotheca triangularis]
MHLNTTTALSHPSILLVPYTARHVPTYHTWMQSPALREATASEPLTLPEEHTMQETWRSDGDKLTFITCLPLPRAEKSSGRGFRAGTEEMIGDVNLFLSEPDEEEFEGVGVVAEVELMVAKPECRRMGYGRAAVRVFLGFVVANWEGLVAENRAWRVAKGERGGQGEGVGTCCFVVKMKEGNVGSIALFESLGFVMKGEGANYFGEVEMRLRPTEEWVQGAKKWYEECEVLEYGSGGD